MKKMAALATVFFAGMYGDNVWDFIRQWAPSLSGDGFMLNIQRLGGVAGAVGVIAAIMGGAGLVVTTIVWCIASAGDDDAKKALRPITSVTGGTLALCVLAASTYVMIPNPGAPAKKQTVSTASAESPAIDRVVMRSVTIGDSTISVYPDGDIKVVQAKSN